MDPNALRECLKNYKDVEIRFLDKGLDRRFLEDSNDYNRLQLCIAAAYSGKYLLSQYEIDQPQNRQKLIQKIGKNHETSILIENLPDFVDNEAISSLLKRHNDHIDRIEISHSNAVVTFRPLISSIPLKYSI